MLSFYLEPVKQNKTSALDQEEDGEKGQEQKKYNLYLEESVIKKV